jgi:short-subunit dehydrogenase
VKVALLGASGGIGRALARQMAARGDELFLLGRDEASLERSARDLEAHGAAPPVGTARCDLLDASSFPPALDRAEATLGRLETVVVSAGLFGTQDELERDTDLRQRMLAVNFAATIEFCEAARPRLLAAPGGTLCVFSSVRRRLVPRSAPSSGRTGCRQRRISRSPGSPIRTGSRPCA